MKFSFPLEITNYILFEFIDEIDYRIRFKKIRKLELNNFQNIINNFNIRKKYIQIFKPLNNDNKRILLMNINTEKYYKITYHLDNDKYIYINIDLINLNNPMYDVFLKELVF